jgi:hypothetical protein
MFTRALFVSAALAVAGLVSGCQSDNGTNAASAAAPATQAVTCSKCKVTWVKYPITAGGGKDHRIIGYRTRKSMECPDCKSAVANFFTTGKFEHTCKTCGPDAMEICEAH